MNRAANFALIWAVVLSALAPIVGASSDGDAATSGEDVHPMKAARGQSLFVALDSDPGDGILNGHSRLLDSDQFDFFAFPISSNSGVYVFLRNRATGADIWTFNFQAPRGQTLKAATYGEAHRYPFHAPPLSGLDAAGENKACNESTGWFKVLEVSYDLYGHILNFSADFVQHCENQGPALYGGVRLLSTLTYPRRAPAVGAGRDRVVDAGAPITLDALLSSDHYHGGLTGFRWKQTSGPAVTLSDVTSATPSFTAPDANAGGTPLGFTVTATDASGGDGSDSVLVTTYNAAELRKRTRLFSPSGEVIGQGHGELLFTEDNALVQVGRRGPADHPTGLGLSMTAGGPGDNNWLVGLEGLPGFGLAVGKYVDASSSTSRGAKQARLVVSSTYECLGSGNFEVIEYKIDRLGYPIKAAIDFDYYCPEAPTVPLSGALRYSSSVPLKRPGPVAYAGKDLEVDENKSVTLDASQSHDRDGGSVTYLWRQTGGQSVTLTGAATAKTKLTTPAVAAGDKILLDFEVTVTNGPGLRDTDSVTVQVNGPRR